MQITLMQGILLAIMTIIVGLDFFVEAFFVFRPLMVSTFTGIILGDVVLGACSEILYISICLYASLFFKLLTIYIFI